MATKSAEALRKERVFKNVVAALVFSQGSVEAIDLLEMTPAWKFQFKNKGKAFVKEADGFLHSGYGKGEDLLEPALLLLIEKCQEAVQKILDEDVTVIDTDG
jgi:hypothetical protein